MIQKFLETTFRHTALKICLWSARVLLNTENMSTSAAVRGVT